MANALGGGTSGLSAITSGTPGPAVSSAPAVSTPQGDYWVGADNNIYTKVAGQNGVKDIGPNGVAAIPNGLSKIADPNAPAATGGSPTTPAATGGVTSSGNSTSGGGTLSQAVIDAVNQSIANDIAQNNGNYSTALSTNQANQANGDTQYGTQLTDNTEGRAQSIQQAEQGGAQGLQGLDAVLASLGALNGTGSVLAGRAVANTTNSDIGGANQTYETNQQAITNAKGAYDTGYNQDDANLKTALDTDNKSAAATGYQDLLDQADSIGDTSLYSKYLPLAVGATTPTQAISPTVVPVSQATTATYGASSPLTVQAVNPTTPTAPASGLVPTNSALSITKDNS